MTPLEQSALPWKVGSTQWNRYRDDIIRKDMLPLLRTIAAGPEELWDGRERPRATIVDAADGYGLRLELNGTRPNPANGRSAFAGGGLGRGSRRISLTIRLHPDLLALHGGDPDDRFGASVARAMIDVLERLLTAERVVVRAPPHGTDGPSDELLRHSARTMRRHAPVMSPGYRTGVEEEVEFTWANPLGQGGATLQLDLTNLRGGRIVDGSPCVCVPGPVRVVHSTSDDDRSGDTLVMMTVGGPDRSIEVRDGDPITMLRMEAEHPWDPDHVRIETRRPIPRADVDDAGGPA
jgi:hypothetical protein